MKKAQKGVKGTTGQQIRGDKGYRYTGREADSGSSHYHYRARAYDPGARQFVQKDPVEATTGANAYGYANGNPVNMIDPSGRSPFGSMTCALLWTFFGASVAFALLGLYSYAFVSRGTSWLIRLYYAVLTTWTWGLTLSAIMANLWSFILLLLNIALWVIINVVLPTLAGWFAQAWFWAQFGFKLQPYLMLLNIGLAIGVMVANYIMIKSRGC